MATPPATIVAMDPDALMNLHHVGRLGMLSSLGTYQFKVPDEVIAEIREPSQLSAVEGLLDQGVLALESIRDLKATRLLARLTSFMGDGEAACLVLAHLHGWKMLSSDRTNSFWKEASKLIQSSQLVDLEDLYFLAIRCGVLSAAEADEDIRALASRNYFMRVKSFRGVA